MSLSNVAAFAVAPAGIAAPRPGLAEPSLSPDGGDGKDIELNPRPVDACLGRALRESGKDSPLDTAVAELLKRLGPKR